MKRVDLERRAEAVFRRHRGVLRTSQALKLGIHPRILYRLRDAGRLVSVTRGVYRLAELPEPSHPDLLVVARRVPQAVICLISALSFHDLTTQIPHEVHIALPRRTRYPRLDHPPLRVFLMTGAAYAEGVETHSIEGVPLRVYGPEKTVVDCFKFRNKIGIDVAVEALRLARERKHVTPRGLLRYARLCRVERVMRPYLEALT
ncbi:MAG: type IV toxin-antitoxin system AbiEi family antitoxin domain-containing protein (plasmid) [Nitrospira sp.]